MTEKKKKKENKDKEQLKLHFYPLIASNSNISNTKVFIFFNNEIMHFSF